MILLSSILMTFAFIVTYFMGELAILKKDWKIWIITFLFLIIAFFALSNLITYLIK